METDYKSQIKLAEEHLKKGEEILKEMKATSPPSSEALYQGNAWQGKIAGFLKENFGSESAYYQRATSTYGIASYLGDTSAHARAVQRTENDTEKCIGILKKVIRVLELKEKETGKDQ